MHPWMLSLKLGIKSLSRHEPEKALRYFKGAIKNCPVKRSSELGTILFYTGITLKKLGLHEGAVKSWMASWRAKHTPLANRHIKRFSNVYGMAKQGLQELDDWKAFYAVQITRYLNMKKSRTLGTLAEKDMLRDLIHDAWMELRKSGQLANKTVQQKMEIFRSVSIVFPFFYGPGRSLRPGNPLRSVENAARTCACGSGLPWLLCCGRTSKRSSADFGVF